MFWLYFCQALGSSVYKSACGTLPECKADNVNVTCGVSSRKKRFITNDELHPTNTQSNRKKRDTAIVKITFNFLIKLPARTSNIKIADLDSQITKAFSQMANITRMDIAAGKYDSLGVDGLFIDKASFTTSRRKLQCPFGMKQRLLTYTCGNYCAI